MLREILTTPGARRWKRRQRLRGAVSAAGRWTSRGILLAAALLTGAIGRSGGAQATASTPQPVFSIGQPPVWQQHLAALAPVRGDSGRGALWLSYGVHRAFFNPVIDVLGGTAEAYTSIGGRSSGARLLAQSKLFGLSVGADWNVPLHNVSPIVSFETAIRRGGLLGHGTLARIDWLPDRSQSVAIGISVPLFRPLAGRTRSAR